MTASPWSEGRQIVHVALQGYELPERQRRPLNLTFLVDVSGSMRSPDKLDLAKKAMNLAIDRLRPQDTLAVTYYAEGAGTTLQPTKGDEKLKMRCAVASLRASGGTAGATGMTNAYDQAQVNFAAERVNRIAHHLTGELGLGHMVLPAPQIDATRDFLMDVLGFGLSDILVHRPLPDLAQRVREVGEW